VKLEPTLHARTRPTQRLPLWRQIRSHLILGFICMALIPAIAITIWTITITGAQAKQQVLNHLDSVASLKYAQLISWLNNGTSQLDMFLTPALRLQLQQYVQAPRDAREEQATLNGLFQHALLADTPYLDTARFQTLFLYDPDGHIIAASNPAYLGRVVHLQPYFAASLTADQVHPPYYASDRLELVIVITKQIHAPNGAVIGVLGGQLDLSMLGRIMTSLNGLGRTGETYLVSHESHYLLTPSRFPDYPLTKAYWECCYRARSWWRKRG
jgi:C4-dicarboxylate-specific signal transduction histidine kinase